jgi:uncharacterized protein (DUF433 family)
VVDEIVTDTIPLVRCADGVIRLKGSRVTLDTIVAAFQNGAAAEEIAEQYPTISLPGIYQVIGYYLRHAEELAEYFAQREIMHAEARKFIESRWPSEGFRERLLARRKQ